MNKNTSYESTVRENLETFDDVDLIKKIKKIKKNQLTDSAKDIALLIIKERGNHSSDDYLKELGNKVEEEIVKEIEEETELTNLKKTAVYKKIKLMNAIGIILWGLGLISSIVFLFASIFLEKINTLTYIISIPFNAFFLLAPFYTWKTCHSENYRYLTPTANALNSFNLIGMFAISFISLLSDLNKVGLIGIAIIIGVPSLINLTFLPSFDGTDKE